MLWRRKKSRYEAEVHFGLATIILLLVFLNVVTTYVVYQTRSAQQEQTVADLRRAALSVSRLVEEAHPLSVQHEDMEAIRFQGGFSRLTLVPGRPADNSKEARREWFREITRRFPPNKFPDLAEKLYRANLEQLTRGDYQEYYYLYPIPIGQNGYLLILAVDQPVLAYLDEARNTLVMVLLISIAVAVVLYFLVSRFIFGPFRRIKEKAEQAGRKVGADEDDAEAIVREYELTIEQLKQSQKELLRLNEETRDRADMAELFNRYLMKSGRSGVISLDSTGQVSAMNDTAVAILGLSGTYLVGQDYRVILGGFPELISDIGLALKGASVEGYRESTIARADGKDRIVGVTLADIRDSERNLVGLLLMLSDMSELRRLRTELEGRKRLAALGEMASGLAHQIRNSLGTIGGYGTLLKKHLREDRAPTQPAEALLAEIEEASNLISRFLSLSRPLDITPEPLDLSSLVQECIDTFRVRPDCTKVSFEVVTGNDISDCDGDRLLLKQALANIVDNAVKAADLTEENINPTVRVDLTADSDNFMVAVSDNGPGLSSTEIEKIFTPFFSTRPSGSGLGLPLAVKIVEMHGGSVSVESAPGQGACFRITLPLTRHLQTKVRPANLADSY